MDPGATPLPGGGILVVEPCLLANVFLRTCEEVLERLEKLELRADVIEYENTALHGKLNYLFNFTITVCSQAEWRHLRPRTCR